MTAPTPVTPNQIQPQPLLMGPNDVAHFAQYQNADGSFVSVGMRGLAILNAVVGYLGTMAQQNADAVAITGGTISGVTITVSVPWDVPSGGTGRASLTAHSILLGAGTSAVTQLAVGTTGQILVGATGADPAWTAATSVAVTSINFGTTGLTPSSATQGAVTVAGTLSAANGGTGVANNAASTITISGNFGITWTVAGTTALTLPASGTLATLAGAEALTNKSMTAFSGVFTFTPSNANATLSPTGTGTVDISPATAGTMNNMVIGGSTPLAGTFTTLIGTSVADSLGSVRSIPHSGSDKTTSYALATTDNGQYVSIGSGGSITIPDATFAAGNVVTIFNNTSGDRTITCTITTAYIAGTDADKATFTLATRGLCTLLFLSGTVVIGSGNIS